MADDKGQTFLATQPKVMAEVGERRLRLAIVAVAEVVVFAAAGAVALGPARTNLGANWWPVWLFLAFLALNVLAITATVMAELRSVGASASRSEPLSERHASEDGPADQEGTEVAGRDADASRRRSRTIGSRVVMVVLTAGLVVFALVLLRVSSPNSVWPDGVAPEYIREGRYVDPDWPPIDGDVRSSGSSDGGGGSGSFDDGDDVGDDVGGGAVGLPDVIPPLTRTADALAAQVAELAFNTLLGEGVATSSDLRAWLLDRGGNTVDTTVNEFLKGAMAQIWKNGDKAVTEGDLKNGASGVPALCDGVAIEVKRILDRELPAVQPSDNLVKEEVALYVRQQLCPVLVLVTPADPGTTPTRPDVPPNLDSGPVAKREERPDALDGDVQIVRRGDSLWTIVERRYPGAPDVELTRRWHSVWFSNRQLIGPDPDVIEPGMRLEMP